MLMLFYPNNNCNTVRKVSSDIMRCLNVIQHRHLIVLAVQRVRKGLQMVLFLFAV